jgi:hypothetical protein
MIKSFYTNSDGANTEGIGAMLQYQLFCYAYCSINKEKFCFDGFKNLQHFQYTNQTQEEFCNFINSFIDFSSCSMEKDSQSLSPQFLMTYGQDNITEAQNHIERIKIKIKNNFKYFKNDELNVAVHIRVLTSTDTCPDVRRELANFSTPIKLNYYENIFDSIRKLHKDKNVKFHIYSQGKPEFFSNFKLLDKDVVLHIDEHPIISLYHMATSDLLVMANSSLSYVAHLLGKNFSIARKTFYHTLCDNKSVRVDADGYIDWSNTSYGK